MKFQLGKVTGTAPLRVALADGGTPDVDPLPLVAGLLDGDIVWCQVEGLSLIIVGRVARSSWVNLSVTAGGWTAPGANPWQARRDGPRVWLRGELANSAFTGGFTTIGTLPAGIPPPADDYSIPIGGNTSASRTLTVKGNGDVSVYSSTASAAWWVVYGAYLID